MNINERIIAKMKELGMRQADLARATGATKGAVNQWFKGATAPSGENLIRLAQALRVTPEWLQFGKESRAPSNVVSLHGGVVSEPIAKYSDADPQDLMIFELLKDITASQKADIIRTLEDQKQSNLAIYEQMLARKRA
jgi:transcriptional regulator with XRE-family HTH domain